MSYVREKLYEAVLCLTSEDPMIDRLQHAFVILVRVQRDGGHFAHPVFEDEFFQMMDEITQPGDDPHNLGYIRINLERRDPEALDALKGRLVGMLWHLDVNPDLA